MNYYTIVLFGKNSKIFSFSDLDWDNFKTAYLKYYSNKEYQFTLLINGVNPENPPSSLSEPELEYLNAVYKDIVKKLLDIQNPDYEYHPIHPPAFLPSVYDIELAHIRYFIKQEVIPLFDAIQNHVGSPSIKPIPAKLQKFARKNLEDTIKKWEKKLTEYKESNQKDNLWTIFYSKPWFTEAFVDTLSNIHCGDCTSTPTSCDRCWAEDVFSLPSTSIWTRQFQHGKTLLDDYLSRKGYYAED